MYYVEKLSYGLRRRKTDHIYNIINYIIYLFKKREAAEQSLGHR